jgi:adenylosuccinate lyase
METNLLNISVADGRYSNITKPLKHYFSEYAYFRYRLQVEIFYLVDLIDILFCDTETNEEKLEEYSNHKTLIKSINLNFSVKDCVYIKEIEKKINHDVKSVEYYIREQLNKLSLEQYIPYIHFGLTSQDINNTAIPLMLKGANNTIYIPMLKKIIKDLKTKYEKWKDIVIISKTHGQSAVPTTFGKELNVFAYRLTKQLDKLKEVTYYGKFGGAVGNFNAHVCSYPDIKWNEFADKLLQKLGLEREQCTTQICNYDNIAEILNILSRIDTILIDMCVDIWLYISNNFLKLSINKEEVGSSTMPQKVNPINFENAEGNLNMANALLDKMSGKLPISRLQRDLTDSTITRNFGICYAFIIIAMDNITKGLLKIDVNLEKIQENKIRCITVLMESIQTILRKHGYKDAYEICKTFSRNSNRDNYNILDIECFITELEVNEIIKKELLDNINIDKYIGYASL